MWLWLSVRTREPRVRGQGLRDAQVRSLASGLPRRPRLTPVPTRRTQLLAPQEPPFLSPGVWLLVEYSRHDHPFLCLVAIDHLAAHSRITYSSQPAMPTAVATCAATRALAIPELLLEVLAHVAVPDLPHTSLVAPRGRLRVKPTCFRTRSRGGRRATTSASCPNSRMRSRAGPRWAGVCVACPCARTTRRRGRWNSATES